jgi:G3E family GTPase
MADSIFCVLVMLCRAVQGGREAVPQWVELANGCLCCSVKAEFVQALEALLDADAGLNGKFDYVLVETTGRRRGEVVHFSSWLQSLQVLVLIG